MKDYTGINKPLNIVSGKHSNIDAKYGPYDSVNHAINSIPISLRNQGLTVGIKIDDSIKEYWWKEGVEDFQLDLKIDKAAYTRTSELTNDANFQSESQIDSKIDALTPLNTKKEYLTKIAANADTNPIGDDNKPILVGQLIVISEDSTPANNGIYRLNAISGTGVPTWKKIGEVGGNLAQYAKTGGSTKTNKDLENEIIQFNALKRDLFPKGVPFSSFNKIDQAYNANTHSFQTLVGHNGIIMNVPKYATKLIYKSFISTLYGLGTFSDENGSGFLNSYLGDGNVKELDLTGVKSIAYSFDRDWTDYMFNFMLNMPVENVLTNIEKTEENTKNIKDYDSIGIIENLTINDFVRDNTAIVLNGGMSIVNSLFRATNIIDLGVNWEIEYDSYFSSLYGLALYGDKLNNIATIVGVGTKTKKIITSKQYPGVTKFAYCVPKSWVDVNVKIKRNVNIINLNAIKQNEDTRLFNPNIKTFSEFNIENPSTPIIKESVLQAPLPNRPFVRIPSCWITNNGHYLIAAEMRKEPTADDFNEMDIRIARKNAVSGIWTENNVFVNDAKGRYMNPSFVEDKTGAHGTANRIWMFVGSTELVMQIFANATREQIDCLYKYSDDEGVTWSNAVSIKDKWDTTYKAVIPSPANGIQTIEGHLVIPAMGLIGTNWRSGIIYKKVGGDWKFSELTPINLENENTVYQRDANKIILDCRIDSKPYFRHIYEFDFATETFKEDWTSRTFRGYLACQSSIISDTIGGEKLYLKTFPDNPLAQNPHPATSRSKLTLWVSKDTLKWIKTYIIHLPVGLGYAVIVKRGEKIIVAYEIASAKVIEVQTLDNIIPLITQAAWMLELPYQERMSI